MPNEFGIEPAHLIFICVIGSLLAVAFLSALCALIGALIGRAFIAFIRPETPIEKANRYRGFWL